MRNLFRYIILFLLLAGFGWLTWYTWESYQDASAPKTGFGSVVPSDAVLLIETDKSLHEWNKLLEYNLMWEDLRQLETFRVIDQKIDDLDSAFYGRDIPEYSFGIAVFADGTYHVRQLFLIKPKDAPSEFLEKVQEQVSEITVNKEAIVWNGGAISFLISGEYILLSFDETLLDHASTMAKSGSTLQEDPQFAEAVNTASRNSDVAAHLYANLSGMEYLLGSIGSDKMRKELKQVFPLAGWSALDMYLDMNTLRINGTGNKGENTFFASMSGNLQSKGRFDIVSPSSAASLLSISSSELIANLNAPGMDEEIRNTEDRFGISISDAFIEWIDNEAVAFSLPRGSKMEPYMAIQSREETSPFEHLTELARTMASYYEQPLDTSNFDGTPIVKCIMPIDLKILYGNLAPSGDTLYFTRHEGYVVAAKSDGACRYFLRQVQDEPMVFDVRYDLMSSDILSSDAGLNAFFSPLHGSSLLATYLRPDLAGIVDQHPESFRSFRTLGIQLGTEKNGQVFVNLVADYNPEGKEESLASWEYEIGAAPLRFWTIYNHRTRSTDLLLQDVTHRIHLLSPTGKARWTRDLQDRITSDVHQIDIFANDKLQMVFTNEQYLQVIDILGRDVRGFPVKASGMLSIADYSNDHDYRLFLTKPGTIQLYDKDGKKVDGWKAIQENIAGGFPLKHLRFDTKDHLITIDTTGYVQVTNRRGEEKESFQAVTPPASDQEFILEKGNDLSTSRWIYVDTLGYVIRQNIGGLRDSIFPGADMEEPRVLYEDINGDRSRDYIVYSRNKIKAFAKDKSLIGTWSADASINSVRIITTKKDQNYIVCIVGRDNRLVVLDRSFTDLTGGAYEQVTYAEITDLNQDNTLELTIATENGMVYQYSFE